jgi:toxin ParE1/3/4
MAYAVKFGLRAERDLDALYERINAEHSDPALNWYQDLRDAILSLERKPNRGSIFQKSARLRQLLYGHWPHIYRVIYRVLEKQKEVEILHVRHGARRRPRITDLLSR